MVDLTFGGGEIARVVEWSTTKPVILMSANGDWHELSAAIRVGPYAVWPKMIDFEALAGLIGDAMRVSLQHHESHSETICRTLDAAGGNVSEAARRLNVSRRTLYRHMRKLGIVVSRR